MTDLLSPISVDWDGHIFFIYAKVKSLTRQYHRLGVVLLVERGIHTLVYLNTFYINYLILLLVPSFNRLTHVSLNER